MSGGNDIEATPKKKTLGKILKVAVPLVVTVGLCIVLFTGVDFDDMMNVISRQCDFSWIIFGMALSVVAQVIRAWRWKLQLNALDIRPDFFPIVLSIFGTYAVNIVFPRLGEIWRTGYIAQRQKAPFATVFGSMIADRFADLILVGLLAIVTFALASPAVMAFVERYPATYQALAGVASSPFTWLAVIAVIAALWWLFTHSSRNRFLKKITDIIRELWKGFAVVLAMKNRFLWVVLSLALWSCYFFQLYVTFFAFPFTRELLSDNGLICPLVCFVLSSMAMAVPSNGGIGPWQMAVIFSLLLYAPANLSDAAAETLRLNLTAYANLVMGMETVLLIILGIFTFVCIFFDKRRHPSTDATV